MVYSLRIVNSLFNSNTYIIYSDGDNSAWLVDCGDYSIVSKWLLKHNKRLRGIFITHGHFDHIYGLNEAVKEFPSIQIYLSSFDGIKIIGDEKLNGSRYAEIPFKVVSGNFVEVLDDMMITIFNGIYMKTFVVKGHSEDSLAFFVEPYFFTGDAFIPNVKTVSKLKGGNKELAKISVQRIYDFCCLETIICPGHKDMVGKQDVNLDLMS